MQPLLLGSTTHLRTLEARVDHFGPEMISKNETYQELVKYRLDYGSVAVFVVTVIGGNITKSSSVPPYNKLGKNTSHHVIVSIRIWT
jgi:hypothetical protein